MNADTLNQLADDAEVELDTDHDSGIRPFCPFPVHVLPEPFRRLVVGGERAIGCDPSFVALPLLTSAAAAIGTSRRIELKPGWAEPPILWTGLIGKSGTQKSPALELALRFVRDHQADAMRDHAEAMAEFAHDELRWERQHSGRGRTTSDEDPPPRPTRPVAERFWTDDVTTEALASLLADQPRGILLVRDELGGWVGSFDRYTGGRGTDVSKYLEAFGGRPWVIDRKTSESVHVHSAAVSITGGIQPETLRRALRDEHQENGLAARILMTWPPRRPRRWTEIGIDPRDESAVARVFDQLYRLQPLEGEDGRPHPRLVPMTDGGQEAWVAFYDAHAAEQAGLDGPLAAAWSKLECYAARLALVLHFIRVGAGDRTVISADAVDERSIAAGVELVRWFGHEVHRVYGMLAESEAQRDHRRLLELIRGRGGAATARDLMRSSRQFPTAAAAWSALEELAASGFGRLEQVESGPKGGRPSQRFVLPEPASVDTAAHHAGTVAGSVNVNAAAVQANAAPSVTYTASESALLEPLPEHARAFVGTAKQAFAPLGGLEVEAVTDRPQSSIAMSGRCQNTIPEDGCDAMHPGAEHCDSVRSNKTEDD